MNAPSSVKMLETGTTQNPATLIIAGPRLYAQRLRFGPVDRSPQKLLADLRAESFPVKNGKIAIIGSPAGLKHEIPLEVCISVHQESILTQSALVTPGEELFVSHVTKSVISGQPYVQRRNLLRRRDSAVYRTDRFNFIGINNHLCVAIVRLQPT